MTRASIPSWPDAKGFQHPTPKAAILADIEAVVGKAAANICVEHAAALAPLLCELVEAEKADGGARLRAVRNG